MSHRRGIGNGFVVVIAGLALVAVCSSPRQGAAQDVAERTRVGSNPEYGKHVKRALEAFRDRRFSEASQAFARALEASPPQNERATLEFNLAASLFELRRYADAERWFEASAKHAPDLTPIALLNAGYCALHDGRFEEAERHLLAAPAGDAEAESRRVELRADIERKRRARARAKLTDLLKAAFRALAHSRPREAQRLLREARPLEALATRAQLANVHYARALTARALEQRRVAREELRAALAASPRDAELVLALADLDFEAGRDREAATGYRSALDLGLTGADAETARRRLAVLMRLDAGFFASAWAGVGYDSNADQSGTAGVSGNSGRVGVGSGFSSLGAALDARHAFSEHWAFGARYDGELTGFFASRARAASLQGHELSLRPTWAPVFGTRVDVQPAVAWSFAGLEEPQPFTRTLGVRLVLEQRLWDDLFVEGWGDWASVRGLGSWGYLSGTRLEGELGASYEPKGGSLRVFAGYIDNAIGTQRITLTQSDFPRCGTRCSGAIYEIPLAHAGPRAGVDFVFDVRRRVRFGGSVQIEWRGYAHESFIATVPESAKLRKDFRVACGAHLEWALTDSGSFSLVPSYDLVVSRSNIAYDRRSGTHEFDYDDADFVQHIAQGRLVAEF